MSKENIAANKVTEEGELPALPELSEDWVMARGMTYTQKHMREYALEAIAADRASCQVANKAEVDLPPLPETHYNGYSDGSEPLWTKEQMHSYARMAVGCGVVQKIMPQKLSDEMWHAWQGISNYHGTKEMNEIYAAMYEVATPPATTGASTSRNEVIEECAALWDSNGKETWIAKAIRELKNKPVGASTVLTDERIKQIAFDESKNWASLREVSGLSAIAFARAIEREVAAQAGQVAVPEGWTLEWDTFTAPGTIRLSSQEWGGAFVGEPKPGSILFQDIIYRFLADMLAAAPSPAKESK